MAPPDEIPLTPATATRRDDTQRCLDAGTLVSIVIPCYNEQEVLPLLFERLTAAARRWPAGYEVVLVDDGSTDNTWQAIEAFHHRDPRWRAIRLSRNFGHQIALVAGLSTVAGRLVAVLDADLQDPPEILPEFFQKWTEGYDVVYGVRTKRKENVVKRSAYFLFYRFLSSISEIAIPLDAGDFCVMDRHVADRLAAAPDQRPFVRGLRAWVGFRQIALPYERHKRAAGHAKYTAKKLAALALNGIFNFSTRPLRVATYLGLLVSAVAFLGVLLTFLQRVFRNVLPGWLELPPGLATVIMAILFLGGVQLVFLGILGEYVGRIYENLKARPRWTVRQQLPE